MLLIMSLIPGLGTQKPQPRVGNFSVKLQNLGIHLQGLCHGISSQRNPPGGILVANLELQVSQLNILMDVNLNILVLILGSFLQVLGDAPGVSTNFNS